MRHLFTARNSIIILFVTACVALNLFAYLIYQKNEEIRDASTWVQHTYEVIARTQAIFTSTQDLITAQRGFLISRDPEFIRRFEQGGKSVELSLQALHDLVRDNPTQQARVAEYREAIRKQRELLADHVTRFRKSGFATGDAANAMLEESRVNMDRVRQLTADILSQENELLSTRNAEDSKRQRNFVSTIIFGSVLSIAGLVIASGIIFVIGRKRQEAEEGLRLSQERFALAIAGMRDGLYDWSVPTGEVYYSDRTREMLGETEASMPPHVDEIFKRIHPEDRAGVHEAVDKYLGRETPTLQCYFRLRHRDGRYLWIMSRGAGVWDSAGSPVRLVGGYTDITEQREFEENLKRMNAELETFTYIASHDLRSPLVNLKGFAGEMKMGLGEVAPVLDEIEPKLDPKQKQVIDQVLREDIPDALSFIHSSVEKMDKLTNGILELSRIGRRELKTGSIDVEKLVESVIGTLSHQINTRNIEVIVGDLPSLISDPLSVEQVFGNVIDNAIKYLDPNRTGRIEIGGETIGEISMYHVKDNGRGVDPADMQRIFEIFRRAGNNEGIAGEGMGMSYVKATLRRLGGTIWCESTKGEGTTFYFTFLTNLNQKMEKAA